MSKTLVANPAAGLQGVPPRIKLDSNSLTIKTGLLGGNKTLPYRNISEVRFNMVQSLTLSGTMIIVPYRGAEIKLLGFYKKQYLLVKQAVENGYFDDGGNEEAEDVATAAAANDDGEVRVKTSRKAPKEDEPELDEETLRLNSQMDSVREIGVATDEDGIVETLNKLLNVLDETSTDEANERIEQTELRNVSKKKFDSQFQMLRSLFPQNKMIPFYTAKVQEWENTEKERKVNDKKNTKKIILALLVCFGLLLLLILIVGVVL